MTEPTAAVREQMEAKRTSTGGADGGDDGQAVRPRGGAAWKKPVRSNGVLLYMLVLVILVLGYPVASWYWAGEVFSPPLWIPVSFTALLLLTAGALVWTLNNRYNSLMQAANDMADGAMNGREPVDRYEETSLSGLEHKWLRFVEQTRAHGQKLELDRQKIQSLVSDISHQTKTPLSSIVLYSELLQELPDLNGAALQYTQQIRSQAAKLDWLIGALVKLSRLEAGMISPQPAHSLLMPMLSNTVSQIYTAAEQKGIGIGIACASDAAARFDPKWTGEALFNILENAVKYSEREGTIQVTVQTGEMFVRVDVADQGIGIAEIEWNRIFQRFYRSPQAAGYEGVGIGLYLAREIVSAQGGYIKVRSGLGEGTVFSLFLPVMR